VNHMRKDCNFCGRIYMWRVGVDYEPMCCECVPQTGMRNIYFRMLAGLGWRIKFRQRIVSDFGDLYRVVEVYPRHCFNRPTPGDVCYFYERKPIGESGVLDACMLRAAQHIGNT